MSGGVMNLPQLFERIETKIIRIKKSIPIKFTGIKNMRMKSIRNKIMRMKLKIVQMSFKQNKMESTPNEIKKLVLRISQTKNIVT